MITIEDLISADDHLLAPEAVEVDPLREVDALQEAQLLDFRLSPLTAVAALLIELRTSLQIDEGNSALMVIRGVRSFTWNSLRAPTPLSALSVMSSVPMLGNDSIRISLGLIPAADLLIQGQSAEFHVLDVEGIGEVPPDYSNGDLAGIRHALPSWSSPCSLLQSSRSR